MPVFENVMHDLWQYGSFFKKNQKQGNTPPKHLPCKSHVSPIFHKRMNRMKRGCVKNDTPPFLYVYILLVEDIANAELNAVGRAEICQVREGLSKALGKTQ